MDFRKFELILKKINTLKQNMDISGDEISELEIDLLKNYIRQMYESVALSGEVLDKPKGRESDVTGNSLTTERPFQPEKNTPAMPVIVPEQKNEVVPVVETKKEVVEYSHYQAAVSVDANNTVEAAMEKKTVVEEKVIEAKNVDSEILDLFSIDSSSDIADKLSSSPLTDIGKGFSINDKILTVNDLFGGKDNLFRETLEFINNAKTFDQAKEWLIHHVAVKENWTKSDKKGKAKHFVKLVRRRLPV